MAKIKQITSDLTTVVNKQISLDETIQWLDQPISTVSRSDFQFMYFFVIIWTIIFLVFFSGKNILGFVIYLALIIAILYPLVFHIKALKTVYLVTDQRAITIEPNFSDFQFKNLFKPEIRKIIFQVLNPFHSNFCDFDQFLLKLPIHSSSIKSYYPQDINNFSLTKSPNKIGNIKLASQYVTGLIGSRKLVYFGFFNIQNPQQVANIIMNQLEEYRMNHQ